MEIDQLEKQVEWLDKERRSDKKTISSLEKKIALLEKRLDKSNEFTKELSSDMNRMGVLMTKIEQYDQALESHRTKVKEELDSYDKRAKRRESDARKRQNEVVDDLAKTVSEFQAKFSTFYNVREELMVRKEDEDKRTKLIGELKKKVDQVDTSESERVKTFSELEEDRRQDKKRIADLQAEVASMRKRTDEHRGRLDLITEGQKRSDARLNEVTAVEGGPQGATGELLEKIAQDWAEREKTWKEWSKKLESIDVTSDSFSQAMISIHEADLAIKQAQREFEQITEQLNRRIHEITEMQRLGEERFRQEWSTFKSEDQKRWTNYALTQEELHKEMNRRIENLIDRATNLEENSQDLQDTVQLLSVNAGKLLQSLAAGARDWMAESERFER
jgi:chromosome segregation ATPase